MNGNRFFKSGVVLGIGLGGFIDGILLHQVFQLHSMLSGLLPQDEVINIKTSMVWDGFFHLLTWIFTCAGLLMLWTAIRKGDPIINNSSFAAALLAGWGLFNFVEGVIDHYILQVHHVVERLGLSIYDHLFVLSGIAFLLLSRVIIKPKKQRKTYLRPIFLDE